jgi:uroporphyrinogen-III synthase
VLVLPWGAIPYIRDGVRPADRYLQLRYQLLVEGLLSRCTDRGKIHFLPRNIIQLDDRIRWGTSIIYSYLKAPVDDSRHFTPKNDALTGLRILIARARPDTSSFAARLRKMNAEVIEMPSISVYPLDDCTNLDNHLLNLKKYDAIVFGCSSGVSYVMERLGNLGINGTIQTIAIGSQAHDALQKAGVTPIGMTPGSCHEAISAQSSLFCGKRLLLITSNDGRPHLQNELIDAHATVDVAIAYRSFISFEKSILSFSEIDLVVLPGSSATKFLFMHPDSAALKDVPMIAIGEMTEAAARQCGATQIVRSPHDNIEAIIQCILSQTSTMQAITSKT